MSHAFVGFETVAYSLLPLSPEQLAFFEALANRCQLLWRLVQSLLDLLVKLLLFHEFLAGLDTRRCGLARQVEKVNIGAHEAF